MSKTIRIKLTDAEHYALRLVATNRLTTISTLIRQSMLREQDVACAVLVYTSSELHNNKVEDNHNGLSQKAREFLEGNDDDTKR